MNYKRLKLLTTGLFFPALLLSAPATGESNTVAGNFINGNVIVVWFMILVIVITIFVLSKSIVKLSKAVSQLKKKSAAVVLLLFINYTAYSQQAGVSITGNNRLPEIFFDPLNYFMWFLIMVLVVTLYVLLKINLKLIKAILPEPEITVVEEAVAIEKVEAKPSFLRKIYLRLVDSVPVAKEKDILLDHDYDGIKELDNNLPPWWKYGFYVTIVFGIFYLIIYHVSGTGKLQYAEYNEELQIAAAQKEERLKKLADVVNEETVIEITDAVELVTAKDLYVKNCAACHRPDGGGQVGPNLTDDFWIHGGGVKNIFKTIAHGVPSKGMISWESQLSPKQIQLVSSYILSIKGTKPEGAKESQGDLWVEEPLTLPDTLNKAGADTLIALGNTGR